MIVLLCSLLLAFGQQWPEPGQVLSTVDKSENFSSIRTFAWERGIEIENRDAHTMLVVAIEAELAARGITLAADRQTADVIVTGSRAPLSISTSCAAAR